LIQLERHHREELVQVEEGHREELLQLEHQHSEELNQLEQRLKEEAKLVEEELEEMIKKRDKLSVSIHQLLQKMEEDDLTNSKLFLSAHSKLRDKLGYKSTSKSKGRVS